jgi:membrane fusion protein (multidrug efflux system)
MKALPHLFYLLALSFLLFISACGQRQAQEEEREEHHEPQHKIVVTTAVAEDVISTQQYVCQIHSRRHIEIRALETGYLEEIHLQEGQSVEQGDPMFEIVPVLYQARLETEAAEAELARIKYQNTKVLADSSIVSKQELALAKAELAKAQAKVKLARAELNYTTLRAPFDGIIDRQLQQQGSLVEEGDILSTVSDNQVMWVYFNVPEARYLEYKARVGEDQDNLEIELKLANGEIFPYPGKIGAIEAEFNNETGNIAFRADFPNPDGLLRHGQTGTILIHRKVKDAIVIPQRATYEILAKKYVYVVESEAKTGPEEGTEPAEAKHGIVRQREIVIQEELEDIYVIEEGLDVNDKIIFEGIRQVRDGDEIDYELQPPEEVLDNLKFHAE